VISYLNQSAEGTAVGTYEGSNNYFFYFGADNSMIEGVAG
jgi:hypothetical protein